MNATSAQDQGASSERSGSRWLFGPASDLLLGYGLGYLLTIPLLLLLVAQQSHSEWPQWIAVGLALFVSYPHYGATILRAYEKREERRKYFLFTVYATIALALLLVVGSRRPFIGSLLFTIYASWSPWHFAGQNYGLGLMSLRRDGVVIVPAAKRLLYTSFVLSAVLAFLEIHAAVEAREAFSISGHSDQAGFQLLRFGLPAFLSRGAVVICIAAYVGTLMGAGVLLLRHASLRQLLPLALLVATQALWFAIPAAVASLGTLRLIDVLPFSFIWISTAHAIQYLWVTAYYDRRSSPEQATPRFLWRSLLAGNALIVVPSLLLAPVLFGKTSWDTGLGFVLFAVVNLHHFILDGAIWKLRDGRVAGVLLRPTPATDPTPLPTAEPRRWKHALTVLGVLSLAIGLHEVYEFQVNYAHVGSDAERARKALDRVRWTGRDSPTARLAVGRSLIANNQPEAATAEFRRSLELEPTAVAWAWTGYAEQLSGHWERSEAAYAQALDSDPDQIMGLYGMASVDLHRASTSDQPDPLRRRAQAQLVRALELRPDYTQASRLLARSYAEAGDRPAAIAILEQAERAKGSPAVRHDLRKLRAEAGGRPPAGS